MNDAYTFLGSGLTTIDKIVTCMYMLVVLVAPICSVAAAYSVVEQMLRKNMNPFMVFKREPVLIIGDHEALAAAILNEDSDKYHFYYVTKGTVYDKEEELGILRKKTVIIKLDDFDDYDNNLEILKTKIRLKKLKRIVVAQKTMAESLSLYLWIAQLCKDNVLSQNVKVYTLGNILGGERILEEFYESDIKKAGMPELIAFDSNEISARRMVKEKLPILNKEDVHIVITGFTQFSQQLTAQLMNRCVTGSNGKIVIDIIDAKVEDGRKSFARRFGSGYITMEEKEWLLAGEKADGSLNIRFHKVNPTGRTYRRLIADLYQESVFDYALICLSNVDDTLAVMLELEQVMKQNGEDISTPIGLRIDKNEFLAEKLMEHNQNVFTFDEKAGNVTMDDIFYETVDQKAKVFNYIYNTIQLLDQNASAERGSVTETINPQDTDTKIDAAWKKMYAFQRSSSRFLADHQDVKEKITNPEALEPFIGRNGSVLTQEGNNWLMEGNDEDFLKRLAECPELEELAKLEHRRWCYAMAMNGWSYAPGKKDVAHKTNPCLVSWSELKRTRPDMCKYDLMPYLYMLIQ